MAKYDSDSDEVKYLRQCLIGEKTNNVTHVVNKLRTMPRVISFIEEYSLEIAQKQLSVEQALEQFDNLDLKKWFFKDLATDFEAWCFALALVLSYPTHVFDCYWIQFYQFHRTLLRFLNRELRATDEQEEQPTTGILPPDDDTLLQKVRAEVEQQFSYPFADIIRFHDNSYPEQLWKVLFKSGRSIFTLLIPLLKELALSQDFYLQRSAAKALGRIGEMDRNYVVFPLIREGLRYGQEILGLVQHCMVSLSFYFDPIQVMKKLLYWMKEEPENLAPLIALLFIRFNGIADELEKSRITKVVNKKDNTLRIDSRILLEASRSEGSTQILTNFLEQIFISLSAFPKSFRRPLQSNFMVLLKIWAMDACEMETIRPTVENILGGLYRKKLNEELHKAIARLLNHDPDFTEKGSKLRKLAVDAMNPPIK